MSDETSNQGVLYLMENNEEIEWLMKEEEGNIGKYEGEIKNGEPNGLGTFNKLDGYKYEGEWKDGTPNGQGTMTYSDGDKHEGEFKDGEANGNGTLIYSSGDKYEGEFKDGEINGIGTYTKINGDKYKGATVLQGNIIHKETIERIEELLDGGQF